MCGRYSVGKDPVHVSIVKAEATFNFDETWNAAPSQSLPVILLENGQLVSRNMAWGILRKGSGLVINARSETLPYKFSQALQHRRCLIPANGFYEWENSSHGKMPWRFCLKTGKSFCFAGLYEQVVSDSHKQMEIDITDEPPKGCIDERFVIVTGGPNQLVKKIHDRMPVIVDPTHYDWWLAEPYGTNIPPEAYPKAFGHPPPSKDDTMFRLALQTYSHSDMDAYRVSQAVNSPKNNSSANFKPI